MGGKSSNCTHCELIVILSGGTVLIFKYKLSDGRVTVMEKSKPAFSLRQAYLPFFLHSESI